MALRRQLDADRVELSGDDGYARYWLLEPRRLDFAEMVDAADSAGYTITKIELELEGKTSEADCASCAKPVSFLTIPETGQRFELAEMHPSGLSLRARAVVLDWAGAHARLSLQK